jgi:hypothetical protein
MNVMYRIEDKYILKIKGEKLIIKDSARVCMDAALHLDNDICQWDEGSEEFLNPMTLILAFQPTAEEICDTLGWFPGSNDAYYGMIKTLECRFEFPRAEIRELFKDDNNPTDWMTNLYKVLPLPQAVIDTYDNVWKAFSSQQLLPL